MKDINKLRPIPGTTESSINKQYSRMKSERDIEEMIVFLKNRITMLQNERKVNQDGAIDFTNMIFEIEARIYQLNWVLGKIN